jgi:hypothetical protein
MGASCRPQMRDTPSTPHAASGLDALAPASCRQLIWIPIWILGRSGVLPYWLNPLILRGSIAFFGVAKSRQETCDWPEKGRAVTV